MFDKTYSGSNASGGAIKNKIVSNQQLTEELHKSVIRKLEKRKVYSTFRNNIWGVNLVDMQPISKFNKGFLPSLCVNHIYSKYA